MNEFVFPGTYLANSEEAIAKDGVYEHDHQLFSAKFGKVMREGNELSVISKKEVKHVQKGQIVYGIVFDVLEQIILLKIEPLAKGRERFVPTFELAAIHISQIKNSFIENLRDEVKKGDIVRARVIETSPLVTLTIKENELGIVKAFCQRCRTPMNLNGKLLICPYCKATSFRKVSSLYGKDNILNEIKF